MAITSNILSNLPTGVGGNMVKEFSEGATSSFIYSELHTTFKENLPETKNNFINEGLQGAFQVGINGATSAIMNVTEALTEKTINAFNLGIVALYGISAKAVKKQVSNLKNKKGFGRFARKGFRSLAGVEADKIAHGLTQIQGNYMTAKSVKSGEASVYSNSSLQFQNNQLQKEKYAYGVANKNLELAIEGLKTKIDMGLLTNSDKDAISTIFGIPKINIDIDKLNSSGGTTRAVDNNGTLVGNAQVMQNFINQSGLHTMNL
jgi:hypothetical protein